jgi:hypothetical protein
MKRQEEKLSLLSNWANLIKIMGGMAIAALLFYLNATYVKRDDFLPVAKEMTIQAEQLSYVNAEVKNISRRLSKIVDDEGKPVNTDKMVEIQRDIATILVKLENLSDKLNKLEKE